MSKSFDAFLSDALEEIELAGLTRRLTPLETPQLSLVRREDVMVVNFSSNDYLGLAAHPAIRDAAMGEWERGGFGSGASRLICGTMTAHEELEVSIARFKRTPAALAFHSGYAAALGTIPAICGKDDVIIMDKLSHACLIDAARLSGAVLRVFPHNDLNKLESHLAWASRKHPQARVLIVVESVYSMDGDLAPLREIVDLKERYGAWLFLDEAHAVGVLGPSGGGLAEELGIGDRIEVQMGTLGKALGAHGAYVAGSRVLRDYLINRARSFIFSTAPPAPVAAAATKAIEIAQSPEGGRLRECLWKNIRNLAAELQASKPESAIIPHILGSENAATSASTELLQKGFLVAAIRFPTVAKGAARLRFTVTSLHHPDQIRSLGEVFRNLSFSASSV
ncbi:MAG: 8-amino-7-oxononanoate synthase [Spartobacteria bacterium Tous-C9RFEB]|nr:MAG: 8-amino-7-oxononanoate synthase [Spartobacteria bacterium Tous-C9RFEB]